MECQVSHQDGLARRGQIDFPRGAVQTPAFMPVGTYGTVKGMLPRDIVRIGAEIILGNTFHLWLRPGTDIIKAHGDLHDFMGWQGPILTDSGGFQVFSLDALRKVTEEGVAFKSPVNGDRVFLDPETSMQETGDSKPAKKTAYMRGQKPDGKGGMADHFSIVAVTCALGKQLPHAVLVLRADRGEQLFFRRTTPMDMQHFPDYFQKFQLRTYLCKTDLP